MTNEQMQQAAEAACKLIASGEMAYFEAITSQFAPLCNHVGVATNLIENLRSMAARWEREGGLCERDDCLAAIAEIERLRHFAPLCDSRLDHAKIAAVLGSKPRELTAEEVARPHAMGSPINGSGEVAAAAALTPDNATLKRIAEKHPAGEYEAEPQVTRKTVWIRRCTDAPTVFVSTLWGAYEDGHELAGIGIPIPLISRDSGKTWKPDLLALFRQCTASRCDVYDLASFLDRETIAAKDAEIRGTCRRCGQPITAQHAMVTHGDSGHSFHQACDLMHLNEAKQGMIDNLFTELAAKDAEIARLKDERDAAFLANAIAVAEASRQVANSDQCYRQACRERDAAVKRAEAAEKVVERAKVRSLRPPEPCECGEYYTVRKAEAQYIYAALDAAKEAT